MTEEYLNFWNNEKKEGASGYRLAGDSYSRKVFPKVYKGAYVAFAGHGSVFGFRTADGGSFFLFGMVNHPKHVNQVLSEALLVPKGGAGRFRSSAPTGSPSCYSMDCGEIHRRFPHSPFTRDANQPPFSVLVPISDLETHIRSGHSHGVTPTGVVGWTSCMCACSKPRL
ncbi:hypothetical protein AAH991_04945 [Microbispora sp. ZYX-F-249]|uniref:Uncharacterized protein n=1 Tax=Microbispora maris TaxID=3144104 RepID=A0ABV0AGH5_9ACTN